VCGSSGCIGSAVVRALRWRGHPVVETTRSGVAGRGEAVALDFTRSTSVDAWTAQLRALDVDAIVNCAGSALPAAASASADRLHRDGPIALFRGAERAGVARIVAVSALGADRCDAGGNDPPARDGWRARHDADEALLGLSLDAAVVRPALVYGPGSRSGAALAALARAPRLVLPDGGTQRLQPLHVFELAEAIATLVERTGSARGVYELAGAAIVTYRELLIALRDAQGGGAAIGLAVPMAIARLAARAPRPGLRGVPDGDVLRLLERVGTTRRNAAPVLLGRAPSTLAEGLAVTPPLRSVPRAPNASARRAGAAWFHPPHRGHS
jgi:nucleoside-diphosphate-sugar epimerase